MEKKFNIRQMQLIAAICLARYCSSINLKNDSISDLISHLFEMSISPDLTAWDQRGAILEVTGRGDPLPNGITNNVSKKNIAALREIIDCAVEVGICDLYGKSTSQPFFFMNKCIDILRRHNIELPSFEIVELYRSGSDAFGAPIHKENLLKILELHDLAFDGFQA
jgi:hypothetical protein